MDQYDLDAFRAKVQQQKGETKKIFKDLKRLKPKELDQEFHKAHDAAFQKIDCLKCANCCKTTGPLFTPSDISRLAKHFRLKPAQFSDQYLRLDEDGDMVLKSVPCPFLGADNYCGVYDIRPKACREYPHTDRFKMHQILALTEKNASLCPAVFEISRALSAKKA
jgi:Fe-S-cluster containining protein